MNQFLDVYLSDTYIDLYISATIGGDIFRASFGELEAVFKNTEGIVQFRGSCEERYYGATPYAAPGILSPRKERITDGPLHTYSAPT